MPSWVAGILWGLAVLAIIVIVTRALGIRTGLAMLTL
jgi:hypothetical protein